MLFHAKSVHLSTCVMFAQSFTCIFVGLKKIHQFICRFQKDLSISHYFVDLKKIYRFEFFSWIWKMFANFWLFCWFQKEFSIWNVFRFENDLFIQNIIVGMKNISRFEKDLSTWKSFVDLGNIYCEWSFSATINSNPLSYLLQNLIFLHKTFLNFYKFSNFMKQKIY